MLVGAKMNEALELLKSGDKRGASKAFSQLAFILRQEADGEDRDSPPTLDDDLPVSEIGLGSRAFYSLMNEGCRTVADVAALTDADIVCIPNSGRKTLEEIRRFVAYRPKLENPR